MQDKLKQLIEREYEAVRNIPLNGEIEQVVELMQKQVHELGGKVVVSGVGKAGHIGYLLFTKLASTGTPACFLSPLEAQHGDLGLLEPNDLLFVLSNSGMTREIIELVEIAERLHPTVKKVVLTKNPDSELGQSSDVTIPTGNTEEICPLGLTPTTSTTVMGVIVDLIVVTLMEEIGFTKEAYALRHHSGYLGKKSRQ